MLSLQTLEGLSLCRDGTRVHGAGRQPRRGLLPAALAAAGTPGPTHETLLALHRPARGASKGQQALAQPRYAPRRDSSDEGLVVDAGTEVVARPPQVITSDLQRFREAIADGRQAQAALSRARPDAAAASYEASRHVALALEDVFQLAVLEARCALVARSRGEADEGARLEARCTAQLKALGAACPPWVFRQQSGLGALTVAARHGAWS